MSEQATEAQIQAKGLTAPRLSLAILSENITDTEIVKHVSKSGQVLRWAVLTTRNGFAVTGKPSASVAPENDDKEIGEQVAIDNARAELWPLMGYALKQRLHEAAPATPVAKVQPEQFYEAPDHGDEEPDTTVDALEAAGQTRLVD